MSYIKDFLESDTQPVEALRTEELAQLVQGYRVVVSFIPKEVLEWLLRLGSPYRLLTRRYEPKTGVLTNVTFEPLEYQIEILEPVFDPLSGERKVEHKVVTLPQEAVIYHESVLDTQPFEEWQSEQNLGAQSLEG